MATQSPPTRTYAGSHLAYDVAVERNVRVPTRDGLTLAADVFRPARGDDAVDQAFPVILERTPYSRGRLDLHLMAQYFAARGYVVVLQDCRGRYDSDGTFTFFLHSHEHEDGFDTLEWIGAQDWCNGGVGTTGLSFAGANQQALAVLRPPHLKTQIILDGGFNYWHRTLRNSGAFHDGLMLPYAFWMALGSREAADDPALKAALRNVLANIEEWLHRLPLRRGASPLARVPAYEDFYFEIATRADYDDVWKAPMPSFQEHISSYPDIPVCLVTSWYGLHTWATFEKFDVLRRQNAQPVRVLVGTWIHGFSYMEQTWAGDVDFGNAVAGSLNDFRLRWFDHWLKGLETGVADEPPIRMFVMGGGDGRRNLAGRLQHGGSWRSEHEWPLARTAFQELFLHADGALRPSPPEADEASTTYTYDPGDPVPSVGGHVQDPLGGEKGIVYGGAFDQRGRRDLVMCRDTLPLAARGDVLVFRTASLPEPVEVTGPVKVTLWVSSSAVDTDFAARLVAEYPPGADYPEGYAMNVCDSIVRMRYRNGRTTAELIEPGELYEIEIDLLPTSNVFAAGHTIRLDVTSSSSPQFDVNPNTGEPLGLSRTRLVAQNTVHHDRARPSRVRLPIVPGGKESQ